MELFIYILGFIVAYVIAAIKLDGDKNDPPAFVLAIVWPIALALPVLFGLRELNNIVEKFIRNAWKEFTK